LGQMRWNLAVDSECGDDGLTKEGRSFYRLRRDIYRKEGKGGERRRMMAWNGLEWRAERKIIAFFRLLPLPWKYGVAGAKKGL
jgi:hypothetical protein